jgi:hypothetical protein
VLLLGAKLGSTKRTTPIVAASATGRVSSNWRARPRRLEKTMTFMPR